MTPQQRMLAAIRGEEVDRLPFATYNCHPFSFGEHARHAEYRPILEAAARTGAGVLCKVRAARSGGLAEAEVSQTVEDGAVVTRHTLPTPAGPLRSVVRKLPDQPARCVEHYLKSDEDVERLLSLAPTPVRWHLEGLLAACEEIGQAGLAYLDYPDPFGSTVELFDQEDFLIRIHTRPAPVLALLEQAFARIRDELHGLLEALSGPRPTVLLYTCGPEWATPPLTSPDVFARMITPYQSRLVAMIHEHGFPVSLHCHGRVRQVLGEILRCGFDVLEPIEPPPQGDIGLAELRSAVGERMALMGYVQDQDFHRSRPEEIRSHVADIVRTVGRDTRFVATPTCTPFGFPPTGRYVANYVAYLEAAGELGA